MATRTILLSTRISIPIEISFTVDSSESLDKIEKEAEGLIKEFLNENDIPSADSQIIEPIKIETSFRSK